MSRLLAEQPGPALADLLSDESIIIQPTGAMEHHGRHLPLGTDAIMAEGIGQAAVEQAVQQGLDTWLLPTLVYMKSDEHAWAPGTVWIDWETMMHTLIAVGRAVSNTRARKLVFLNGHGGNTALLQVALREIRREFGLETFFASALTRSGVEAPGAEEDDEAGFSIHGGAAETSLMMHLRPDLVHLEHAERSVPEHLLEFERLGFNSKPASFGWLSNDFADNGIIGDARAATSKFGEMLYENSVRQTVRTLHEVHDFRFRPEEG